MTQYVVVQGRQGILGRAYFENASRSMPADQILAVDSRDLFNRMCMHETADLASMLPLDRNLDVDWICAAGNVDPSQPSSHLLAVNANLPRYVLSGLCNLVEQGSIRSARFVTFGSVLEKREALAAQNAYLASKFSLWTDWQKRAANLPLTWHHIQLHTLYGRARAHPFMFLGQIETALRKREPFSMSAGRQLREYHHVQDVVANVASFLSNESGPSRSFDLSSGQPVSLGGLATDIFAAFDLLHLLHAGMLPEAKGEVFAREFERTPYLMADRDPTSGIIDWLRAMGVKGE